MNPPDALYVRPLYPKGAAGHAPSQPGADVVAIKRALSRTGFLPWQHPFSGKYDTATAEVVQAFQAAKGIRPTGWYGRRTHEALRRTKRDQHPTQWAFDAYSLELLGKAADIILPSPIEKARAGLVDAVGYWIVRREEIAYAHGWDPDVRPFPLVKPPAIPKKTDCSGFATTAFYAIGAPDPNGKINGREYSGYGYTGTLIGNGDLVGRGNGALAAATVGCLIFYGSTLSPSPAFPVGSPTHVAVYIGGGYVGSMGSDPGPLKLDADYRTVNQVRRYPLLAA